MAAPFLYLGAGFQQDMGLENKKGGSEKPPRLVQNIRSNISTQHPQHRRANLINEM
jgi:hypothetical protein